MFWRPCWYSYRNLVNFCDFCEEKIIYSFFLLIKTDDYFEKKQEKKILLSESMQSSHNNTKLKKFENTQEKLSK